ncbi:hypothetical protein IEQ34_016735 [Dendrobium chrysotoxum]|uniref:RIN4 pathogenic type III effector avirulence factor Avr cleavage site domain-containing protein n=1 Tax=Dendrobium chrysotoxum TaxID=161865 RepID=A0AAV7GEG0_DENCH|nr:hypothetical protein IEQ34_016735 [Dendrobium chrysotoxum]
MALNPASPYRKEKDGWMAVPQFGGWDQKAGGGTPDYSMVFTRARANRKQQKIDVSSSSLGHEKEFLNFPVPQAEQNSAMKKRSFFSCFSCGVKN